MTVDEQIMLRAIELARRGRGQTRPNPAVGAVIVRDGRIIGEGWHHRAGDPHAEREALAACVEDPRGATMYVTLEPCCHFGRTPPCADALIEFGIARVVIGQLDPNAKACGGARRLQAAGVEIASGVCEQEAMLLNPGFNTFHLLARPCVTLKWAMSADGCTSSASGHSTWISSEASRHCAHQMRAENDAVLIGVETAMQDNARLTIRGMEPPPGPPLLRLILDPALRLPSNHPFLEESQGRAVIVCAEDASEQFERELVRAGATVWRTPRRTDDLKLDLHHLIERLYHEGVQNLMVEGGRHVAGYFLSARLVDRIAVFMAPVIIGCGHEPLSAVATLAPIQRMDDALRLHLVTYEVIGDDVLMQAWLTRHLFTRPV